MRTLIVGGSGGIGSATMTALGRRLHDVHDLSRRSGVDVSDRTQLDKALADLGPVDHLVYCAGHVDPGPFEDVTDDAWDYHMEVNLTAAARCFRWYEANGGSGAVVFVASTAATRPSPGWSAYAAAKAGLINLGITLAEEFHDRMRVYVVAPGRCATELRAKLAPDEDPSTIMRPDQVAAQIAHLILGDPGGVLAGHVIPVKQ